MAVVGGGLAGLTCALDLAEAGLATTLIERRPFVGGKTFSFTDPGSGVELDNGQHVYLRCCTAYLALIERLGLQDDVQLQPRLRVPVLDPETGAVGAIAALPGPLPAPLNLAWSLLRFTHLRRRERLTLGRAVLPLLRMPDDARRRLDGRSFGDWLRAHGQSQRVIERFWDLIILPTCNDTSDAVSAAQAAYVLKTGLLQAAHGADIGVARVGLSRIAEAARERFESAGGRTRLGTRAAGLIDRDGRAGGVALAGGPIEADSVVLALPPNRARALLPGDWRDRRGLADLEAFRYSPIVNVHLRWDRPLLRDDFVAVLDPDVQYVFNRTRIGGRGDTEPDGGQWITVSLSGAHAQAGRPQADVAAATIAALRRAFPPSRGAPPPAVTHWRVIKEMEATFRPAPGVAALRPGPVTGVERLFLAGAWTDTQWPATMESAVRSGHAAAVACRAALADAGA